MTSDSVDLQPIGVIRLFDRKLVKNYEYPAQGYMDDLLHIIELAPKQNFEQCLKDLDGFSHIWILFLFHESETWKPTVIPPRGPAKKRGVFATRSPNRPNSIGMTVVELMEIRKRQVLVKGGDFFEDTPLLDIKPYIIRSDSYPKAKQGWIDEIEKEKWLVNWELEAKSVAEKVFQESEFRIREYVTKVLEYNRESHPYRRIYLASETSGLLKIQRWRVAFELFPKVKEVKVIRIWLDEND